MRVLNNRHWVSDVLSGAGIGIMSAELAYALSDLIFKKRGLLRADIVSDKNIIEHPSFFSISMGMGFGSKNLDFDMEQFGLDFINGKNFNLKFGTSTAVGAEGAYFFNKYVGVGGRVRVNSSPIKGWNGIVDYAWEDLIEGLYGNDHTEDEKVHQFLHGTGIPGQPGYSPALIEDAYFTIKSDHLTEFTADAGVYINLPLSKRFAIGTKFLLGTSVMQEVDLNATVSGGMREIDITKDSDMMFDNAILLPDTYTSEWDYFTVGGNKTAKFGTGLSLTYAYKENYAWRLFCDYDYTRKTYTMTYDPSDFLIDATGMRSLAEFMGDELNLADTQKIKKNRNTFIIGGSFTISF